MWKEMGRWKLYCLGPWVGLKSNQGEFCLFGGSCADLITVKLTTHAIKGSYQCWYMCIYSYGNVSYISLANWEGVAEECYTSNI